MTVVEGLVSLGHKTNRSGLGLVRLARILQMNQIVAVLLLLLRQLKVCLDQ